MSDRKLQEQIVNLIIHEIISEEQDAVFSYMLKDYKIHVHLLVGVNRD